MAVAAMVAGCTLILQSAWHLRTWLSEGPLLIWAAAVQPYQRNQHQQHAVNACGCSGNCDHMAAAGTNSKKSDFFIVLPWCSCAY